MKRLASIVLLAAASAALGATLAPTSPDQEQRPAMALGAFSVSLAVADLEASRAFYAKLGFTKAGGVAEQNWLIMRNGTTTIGLFQGMFEKNMLTFNPGWTWEAKNLEAFEDVREIQARLRSQGLELLTEADETTKGPASLTLLDPDGNPILLDQHVPSPGD